MLDAIRTFFTDLAGAEPATRFEETDYRLAAAALLVHVSAVDGDVSARERAKLHGILKSAFNLDDRQTEALIAEATLVEGESVDLYSFTRLLTRALDDQGRARIVEMMWELSFADGRVNEFEDNLIWRAADLLNVPSHERIALKQRVEEQAAAADARRALAARD